MTTPPPPSCLDCNYALIGVTTPRCPECGRDFDPADPATYGPHSLVQSLLIPVAMGLCWPGALALFVFSIGWLVTHAIPFTIEHAFRSGALALWFAVVLTVFALPIVITLLIAHSKRDGVRALSLRRAWALHLCLLTVLIAPLAHFVGVFWSVQWMLSRHALRDVVAGKRPLMPNETYGIIPVAAVNTLPDGTLELDLAWPARWSTPPPQLRHGPIARMPGPSYPFIKQLSDGWWIVWSD